MRAAVVTVSDRSARGEREDRTGPELRRILAAAGIEVVESVVVSDDVLPLTDALRRLGDAVDVVLTTGGTGIGPRDVTPDVTRKLLVKELPGFGEAMRRASLTSTPRAILSRATAGVIGRALVVNLPGSPGGAVECLGAVLPAIPHAVHLIAGAVADCRDDTAGAAMPKTAKGREGKK
ncbi:MAG: MogA/MoaB family molybdenum cofactor biosynthesis protein [Planctomycetes bacterium]|nr:MogA/MoaB family molybdenum cofactor biosynthesis protein [Planctomycetota bacterium]MBI3845828.1 MogA/MoaB family molybdenum cofactor biosynthesis protein [Planctomycetota bacterium]